MTSSGWSSENSYPLFFIYFSSTWIFGQKQGKQVDSGVWESCHFWANLLHFSNPAFSVQSDSHQQKSSHLSKCLEWVPEKWELLVYAPCAIASSVVCKMWILSEREGTLGKHGRLPWLWLIKSCRTRYQLSLVLLGALGYLPFEGAWNDKKFLVFKQHHLLSSQWVLTAAAPQVKGASEVRVWGSNGTMSWWHKWK